MLLLGNFLCKNNRTQYKKLKPIRANTYIEMNKKWHVEFTYENLVCGFIMVQRLNYLNIPRTKVNKLLNNNFNIFFLSWARILTLDLNYDSAERF